MNRKQWWQSLTPAQRLAKQEAAIQTSHERRAGRLGPKLAAQRKLLIEERKRLLGPDWSKTPPLELAAEEVAS